MRAVNHSIITAFKKLQTDNLEQISSYGKLKKHNLKSM